MLHILLVILKIFGIILACVLGLLLLLILLVLFVPLRYRVDAKKREEIIIKMRLHWLLRIIFVRIWYINKQLHIKLRVFGIPIWDNLKPKKEKKAKKKKRKKGKASKAGKSAKSKKQDKENQNQLPSKQETGLLEDTKEDPLIAKNNQDDNTKTVSLEKKSQDNLIIDANYSEDVNSSSKTNSNEENSRDESLDEESAKDETSDGESDSKLNFIQKIFHKIKGFFRRISKLGVTIKTKVTGIIEFIRKLGGKKNLVTAFIQEELNRAGIKMAFGQLIEVLKYCGPQTMKGYVKFGTGDPEQTGKILAVAALFYGRYGETVTIEPDFEEKVFEAEGMVKGRIRIIRLLIIGIKVIRDKNLKQLVKNVKQLKEEL